MAHTYHVIVTDRGNLVSDHELFEAPHRIEGIAYRMMLYYRQHGGAGWLVTLYDNNERLASWYA